MSTERMHCPCGYPVDVRINTSGVTYWAEFAHVTTGRELRNCPDCQADLVRALRVPTPTRSHCHE